MLAPAPHGPAWFLSEAEWNVALQLNGRRNLGEVVSTLDTPSINESFVVSVVDNLSRKFLLDDDVYEEALFRELDAFRKQPYRAMVGSGHEYSSDNIDLRIQLGGIVADDWDMPQIAPIHAFVLPAHPFGPAAKLYARGYAALRHQIQDIARIVLLGASEIPLGRLLVPLTLSSKTAFGISELDKHALRALSVVPGRDELAHRESLVLERHQLFTTLLAPQTPVLPILVGQMTNPIDQVEEVESAVQSLLRVLALPGRTVLIAASDLARFDHEAGKPSRELRTTDADLSDHATRMDADRFWEAACQTKTGQRSPTAIYLLLSALARLDKNHPQLRGAVAGYLQLRDDRQLTSAASIAFFEET